MKLKQKKPTYGNSQGAKPREASTDRGHKKSSAALRQQYAQSGEFTDRKHQQDRLLRSNSVTLDSLPRKIFKVGIIGFILCPLLVYTPIGKSITTRISQGIAGVQQKIGSTQSEVNLKTMTEKKQKAADDRFDDTLKRAGDESAGKNHNK
jgi:hypothetical protein